jgi:hypothetical protein
MRRIENVQVKRCRWRPGLWAGRVEATVEAEQQTVPPQKEEKKGLRCGEGCR